MVWDGSLLRAYHIFIRNHHVLNALPTFDLKKMTYLRQIVVFENNDSSQSELGLVHKIYVANNDDFNNK